MPLGLLCFSALLLLIGPPSEGIVTILVYFIFGLGLGLQSFAVFMNFMIPSSRLEEYKKIFKEKVPEPNIDSVVSGVIHLACMVVFSMHSLTFFVVCSLVSLVYYQMVAWMHK